MGGLRTGGGFFGVEVLIGTVFLEEDGVGVDAMVGNVETGGDWFDHLGEEGEWVGGWVVEFGKT